MVKEKASNLQTSRKETIVRRFTMKMEMLIRGKVMIWKINTEEIDGYAS